MGFVVYAGVRNEKDADAAQARHANIRALLLDVTDSASIVAAAKQVAENRAPLAGLVNNAGIAVGGPLEFLPVDRLRHQFDVNVFGAVAVTQAFAPQLREYHGRIVFVGSVSGRVPVPYLGAYSASKFALRAIADAMRIEFAQAGVFVSLIEPSSVKTPIWKKGRDSSDNLIRVLGPQAVEHHGAALERMSRRAAYAERTGMPVERVTNAIVHALTARRPKTNYLVGSRAASVIGALPTEWRDRLIFGVRRLH